MAAPCCDMAPEIIRPIQQHPNPRAQFSQCHRPVGGAAAAFWRGGTGRAQPASVAASANVTASRASEPSSLIRWVPHLDPPVSAGGSRCVALAVEHTLSPDKSGDKVWHPTHQFKVDGTLDAG